MDQLYKGGQKHHLHCFNARNIYPESSHEALYSQQKQDQEQTVAQIMNFLLANSDLIEESKENY